MSRVLDGSSGEASAPSYGTFPDRVTNAEATTAVMSLEAAMESSDTKYGNVDSGHVHGQDVLKGDIVVGIIAGEDAIRATENEHNLSLRDAVRLYPAAIGWSAFFSLGIIMTAFDPQLLGNLYATPKFQQDFGYLYEGSWIIKAQWQTGPCFCEL
ncbi:hypothetical protein LTR97_006547 [Elasticomyces elasticus]|uniref:Uncharacterized protein n=1 Tax=Elasticomyces elasticus TaxID=574655 RepID=A0AAN7W6H3_9PEZI|nr:hypothetical protein LTR97_006547 [Elasticomyces elasticus]